MFNRELQTEILDNGVTIILERVPESPLFSAGVFVNVGARDDGEGKKGIAHFVEHMVFQGTTKRSKEEIARCMEDMGGATHGFTSREITGYVSCGLNDYALRGLDVAVDLVANPVIPEKEIEREKSVVDNEMSMYLDHPYHHGLDRLLQHKYPYYGLGGPIVGNNSDVFGLTRDDVFSFVEANYRSEGITVVVVGDVGADEIRQVVSEHDIRLGQPQDRSARKYNEPNAGRFFETTKSKLTHVFVSFPWPWQSVLRREGKVDLSEWHSAQFLSSILGGGTSSRLFRAIRERYGHAYHVSCHLTDFSNTLDFIIYTAADPPEIGLVKEVLEEALVDISKNGIEEWEMKKALNIYRTSLVKSAYKRMLDLGVQRIDRGKCRPLEYDWEIIARHAGQDMRELATRWFDFAQATKLDLVYSELP